MKNQQLTRQSEKRKNYTLTDPGFDNPTLIVNGLYDSQNLSPWATWHGSLNAQVLLVGKDFRNHEYYLRDVAPEEPENSTDSKLRKLFIQAGLEIGIPAECNGDPSVYFTNAVLGIKKSGGSGRRNGHIDTADLFLSPLIDIIQPKVIIAMGQLAYETMAHIFLLPKAQLKNIVGNNPVHLPENKKLFVVYNCSGAGLTNRSFEKQKEDWSKIRSHLERA